MGRDPSESMAETEWHRGSALRTRHFALLFIVLQLCCGSSEAVQTGEHLEGLNLREMDPAWTQSVLEAKGDARYATPDGAPQRKPGRNLLGAKPVMLDFKCDDPESLITSTGLGKKKPSAQGKPKAKRVSAAPVAPASQQEALQAAFTAGFKNGITAKLKKGFQKEAHSLGEGKEECSDLQQLNRQVCSLYGSSSAACSVVKADRSRRCGPTPSRSSNKALEEAAQGTARRLLGRRQKKKAAAAAKKAKEATKVRGSIKNAYDNCIKNMPATYDCHRTSGLALPLANSAKYCIKGVGCVQALYGGCPGFAKALHAPNTKIPITDTKKTPRKKGKKKEKKKRKKKTTRKKGKKKRKKGSKRKGELGESSTARRLLGKGKGERCQAKELWGRLTGFPVKVWKRQLSGSFISDMGCPVGCVKNIGQLYMSKNGKCAAKMELRRVDTPPQTSKIPNTSTKFMQIQTHMISASVCNLETEKCATQRSLLVCFLSDRLGGMHRAKCSKPQQIPSFM